MRVYRYGLRAPVVGADLVAEQLRLAHRYQCDLLEVARGRRAAEREVELAAGLDAERAAAQAADEALAAALQAAAKAKMLARKRTAPPAERAAVKVARAARKEARAELRARRKELAMQLQPDRDRISLRWCEMRRSLRRRYSQDLGLRHGTYTAVEDAVDRACKATPLWDGERAQDPRYPRWDGTGSIGVQLQGGRSLPEILGDDTMVQIQLDGSAAHSSLRQDPQQPGQRGGSTAPQGRDGGSQRSNGSAQPSNGATGNAVGSNGSAAPEDRDRASRASRRFGVLKLRVGSDDKRRPIWAEWPLLMHRPIPRRSRIKRVMVSRRTEGPRECWTVELTVDEPEGYTIEPCGQGTVATDIGWRSLGDGTVRVAAWTDDEVVREPTAWQPGEPIGGTQQLVLDEALVAALRKPSELRSIRDERLNIMRAELCAWLREQGELPEWLRRRTVRRREGVPSTPQAIATLAQWRSPRRFAALARAWARVGELADGYAILEAWRVRDHHLWAWESGQRAKSLRRRRELYRLLGAALARRYSTVVLEVFNISGVARVPDHDETRTEQQELASGWRQLCSVHELRDAIGNACKSRGAETATVPAAYSTQECPHCGCTEAWDAAASIQRRPPCSRCERQWDQDSGAAVVLLRRHRERCGGEGKAGTARNGETVNESNEVQETRWARVARLRAEKETRMAAARKTGTDDTE